MFRVLVIGAGYVAGPVLEYLLRDNRMQITLASVLLEESVALAKQRDRVKPIVLNVENQDVLGRTISEHDIVLSLVPYQFHVRIAKLCIAHKKHLVTASYESAEMRELQEQALNAGITIINEIGLDPGIDHLLAMQVIEAAREQAETIESFVSWCGGLPSPDYNDNPLGYKFAWSPRAVLLALLNEARFINAAEEQCISGEQLLHCAVSLPQINGLLLEGYPNRNSTQYTDIYGLQKPLHLLRGTLRYPGFARIMQACKDLGLFSLQPLGESEQGISWRTFIEKRAEASGDKLSEKLDVKLNEALTWLGLFSDNSIPTAASALDAFCLLLQEKLSYQHHERDMIILIHKFVIRDVSGQVRCVQSSLIEYGDENYSAMAKTVGIPVAITASLLLSGVIQERGVILPVSKAVYLPIIQELNACGFQLREDIIDEKPEVFIGEMLALT